MNTYNSSSHTGFVPASILPPLPRNLHLGGVIQLGDHLRSTRGMYYHHGIYVGEGQVVHYAGDRTKDTTSASVRLGTLAEFADGRPVEVVPYGQSLPPMEVVLRARALLGEARYNLVLRNCEHLATLAKVGEPFSNQVREVLATAGAPLAAKMAAVFLAGGAALSLTGAASTMKSLATAGSLVGGGPLAGVAVTGAAVGAASLATLFLAYRDDPYATDLEREACSDARLSGWSTLFLGALGTTFLVACLGRGNGAAVVSSGLKSIGKAVGGGMAAGAIICTGAPLVAAAVSAKTTYKRSKKRRTPSGK
ncbi:lecithin retinol acyltransferase family protein [Archangium primigenium]|uniref:lecithin retinol acyltransferase family protein n=1 Tax=[Archangium] primigenium TaxID=2792470 RepID=UPI00195B0F9D|nr:lecithin retinol acyltransferase family protein [Archangium primigenium]MBM7116217.1 lecithin retinol acyltransferase family protein [Archangium primigenium]